jgi:uncharacterized protein YbcI
VSRKVKAACMTDERDELATAVSNAMIRLHKEQFGRGPRRTRSYLVGPDALVCFLEDVLLPAERKLVEMGEHDRVRETRLAFQVATEADFIAAVEEIVQRKVRSFATAVDVKADLVSEIFYFERTSETADRGAAPPGPDGVE